MLMLILQQLFLTHRKHRSLLVQNQWLGERWFITHQLTITFFESSNKTIKDLLTSLHALHSILLLLALPLDHQSLFLLEYQVFTKITVFCYEVVMENGDYIDSLKVPTSNRLKWIVLLERFYLRYLFVNKLYDPLIAWSVLPNYIREPRSQFLILWNSIELYYFLATFTLASLFRV